MPKFLFQESFSPVYLFYKDLWITWYISKTVPHAGDGDILDSPFLFGEQVIENEKCK